MIYLLAFVLVAFIVAMLPLVQRRKHLVPHGWSGMIALLKFLWPIVLAGGFTWFIMAMFYRVALVLLGDLDVLLAN